MYLKKRLDVTLIGQLKPNDEVNLELALCAGDHLGGHIVSGHVDGVAILQSNLMKASQHV
jgi:Riboflavin synthase alpha chain